MKNLLTALSILVIGFTIAFLIATMKPKPEKLPQAEVEAIQVSAVMANPESKKIRVLSHGLVEASHAINLISEVSGRVIQVNPNFINGGSISKHEIIVRIDDTQYQAELAAVQADIALARETLSTEKARSIQSQKEWRDLGSEEANALFLRKPQLNSAQARLNAAESRLTLSKQKLSRTKLTLPYSANILETFIHQGQYLSPGNKIASLYHSEKRQVKLQLSQQQLKTANIQWPIQIDNPPQIELFDTRSKDNGIKGTLISRGASIDSKSQLVDLIVELPPKYADYFLPGLYIEAYVSGEIQDRILTLPEDAFHDKRYLLIANDENQIEFIDAQFLSRHGNNIQLTAEIEAGTTIITSRLPLATPGMKVIPVLPSSKTPTAH